MDDIVKQAMVKWPNVPDCFGWLGLDNRGQWYMRDERVQALGGFQSGIEGAKGSLLRHEKLISFIHRNYESDDSGSWYFQNGPQRVFIELESTPYIWRLGDDLVATSSTGCTTEALGCLMDETGYVYLQTPMGIGLVHTLDVVVASEALESGIWQLQECLSESLESQYGFVRSPEAKYHKIKA